MLRAYFKHYILSLRNLCYHISVLSIQLGAVEFLRKPLSEEKLKNIWQHVVHKVFLVIHPFSKLFHFLRKMGFDSRFFPRQAFSAGGNTTSESIKTNSDSMVSLLQLQIENANAENQFLKEQDIVMELLESGEVQISCNEKFPAPSTPQLKQGGRLLDDMDYQDQTNSSTDKESVEHQGEPKFVETTTEDPPQPAIKEEDHTRSYSSKSSNKLSSKEDSTDPPCGTQNSNKEPDPPDAKTSNRKKIKVMSDHDCR